MYRLVAPEASAAQQVLLRASQPPVHCWLLLLLVAVVVVAVLVSALLLLQLLQKQKLLLPLRQNQQQQQWLVFDLLLPPLQGQHLICLSLSPLQVLQPHAAVAPLLPQSQAPPLALLLLLLLPPRLEHRPQVYPQAEHSALPTAAQQPASCASPQRIQPAAAPAVHPALPAALPAASCASYPPASHPNGSQRCQPTS
jgi:hypothetical protein